MKQALLFTGYPKRFVERHVIPKLKKFGIEVLCIGDADRPTERCASEADLVLCMHERMSHSSDTLIREIAKKHELRVVYLPRKSSSWYDRLTAINGHNIDAAPEPAVTDTRDTKQEETTTMTTTAAPKSAVYQDLIPADKIDEFYRDVMSMSDDGKSYAQIIPVVQHYFNGFELTGESFRYFLAYERARPDAPEWFKNWRAKKGNRRFGAVTKKTKVSESEMETLANEYATENTILKARIKELEAASAVDPDGSLLEHVQTLERALEEEKRVTAKQAAWAVNAQVALDKFQKLAKSVLADEKRADAKKEEWHRTTKEILTHLEGLAVHEAIDAKFVISTMRRFLMVYGS